MPPEPRFETLVEFQPTVDVRGKPAGTFDELAGTAVSPPRCLGTAKTLHFTISGGNNG